MKLSVFTPVHPGVLPYLAEAAQSLGAARAAAHAAGFDTEWLIGANGGVTHGAITRMAGDGCHVIDMHEHTGKIGALKRVLCTAATGDVLVELDGDDLLRPAALRSIGETFASGGDAAFAYSDAGYFIGDAHGNRKPTKPFDAENGWRSYTLDGEATVHHSWPATYHALSRIYWAPDHVRAWRRSFYEAIGGHDARLEVGDDHGLLQRTYLSCGEKGMVHLAAPLYLYRVRHNQSFRERQGTVTAQSEANYRSRIQDLALRWTRDQGLRALDLGSGRWVADGFEGVDHPDAGVSGAVEHDLRVTPWPFDDSSAGVIRASHIVEHLPDRCAFMREVYRVLAPGGLLLVEVPSAPSRGAFSDPTHVSFWCEETFRYYTQDHLAQFLPPADRAVRLQEFLLVTEEDPAFKGRDCPVVRAHLVSMKDGFRAPGRIGRNGAR